MSESSGAVSVPFVSGLGKGREAFHAEVISRDADLALLDSYLRNKSAHFRRAFALG